MSIFREYESEEEKQIDILAREYDLSIHNANSTFALESAMLSSIMKDPIYEGVTGEEKTQTAGNKFKEFLKSIVNAVKNFVNGTIEMIQGLFSSKENIDLNTYLKSNTGQIQLDYDIKDIQRQVEDERRKGRKLIQRISSVTGVDDKEVESFVDNAADFANKHTKTIIKTAIAAPLIMAVPKLLNKGKDNISDCANDANKVTDPKKQSQIQKVLNKMSSMEKDFGSIMAYFCKNLEKDMKKNNKK